MFSIEELNDLLYSESLEELFLTAKCLADRIGFPQTLFALKPTLDSKNKNAIIISNYAEVWRTKYDSEQYAEVDPVVTHSFRSILPIIWDPGIYKNQSARDFYEEASAYGLNQGATFPMRGTKGQIGMLSLKWHGTENARYKEKISKVLPNAIILRDFVLESATKIIGSSNPENIRLTKRELEVLKWSAAGKTTWETSVILAMSTDAIEFHFKNIRKKFKVSSRKMAIIKAIQINLLSI